MKTAHVVAFILAMVGALNWGVIGLTRMMGGGELNVVETLVGPLGLADIVYVLVGAAAVYVLLGHQKDCKICSKK